VLTVKAVKPSASGKVSKRQACEGSGNGHVGTGQVGSTCCHGPAGTCCVVGVTGTGGKVETKVECSGDFRLWFTHDAPVKTISTRFFPSIAAIGAIVMIVTAAVRWRRRRSALTEVYDIEDEQVEDVE